MDNVTHSLAGLVLAESAMRIRQRWSGAEPSPVFRTVAIVTGLVAANLPDADLVYSGLGGDRLAYMLHHRGHTHTVIAALAGAMLLWLVVWLSWRWWGRRAPTAVDGRWLLGIALAGTLSHILLDWTNSYGVHPFWPLDDRWYYGDAVFIVEPWFWVVSVPTLVVASRRSVARVVLSLVLLAGVVLAWRVELVGSWAAAALTLGAGVAIVLAHRFTPARRIALVVVGWMGVEVVMATGAAAARSATVGAMERLAPATALVDVVVTPLPANPVCFSVVTVERAGGVYAAATARVSVLPAMVDAGSCGVRGEVGGVLVESARPRSSSVHWDAEWSAEVAELAELARQSCPVHAALRFIRAPAWRMVDDSTVVLGDLRFGDVSGGGFTDLRLPARTASCPPSVPPWTPPRAALLTVH